MEWDLKVLQRSKAAQGQRAVKWTGHRKLRKVFQPKTRISPK